MAEYIELIDKYRIVQSKDTDYNPPSYEWVDNTGQIVRCKDCKYAHMTYDGDCKYCDVWFPDEAEYLDGDYYCASAERKEETCNNTEEKLQ